MYCHAEGREGMCTCMLCMWVGICVIALVMHECGFSLCSQQTSLEGKGPTLTLHTHAHTAL